MKRQFIYGALGILALASCKEEPKIMDGNVVRVNQVGYYPDEEKTATVEVEGFADEYLLLDADGMTVWKGEAVREATSEISQKKRQIVDFSEVKTPGSYIRVLGRFVLSIV